MSVVGKRDFHTVRLESTHAANHRIRHCHYLGHLFCQETATDFAGDQKLRMVFRYAHVREQACIRHSSFKRERQKDFELAWDMYQSSIGALV